jgi:hypothetical protein
VLAELDLVSGRLRYIAAGHPYPLLMRDGRVVKSLTGGRRSLFGLPTANMSVAEEFLEPGDWLTLYTDGITKARDEAGNLFGEERLVDFLRREAASSHPPPETVRRLVHAVMRHQRGVLQDDATILLARWDAQLRPERRHHVLPLSRRVRRRTAEYLGVLVPERQGVGMAVGRGEDLVPAVVRLRLPRPADPATVEALLARAMAAADPPIAAELAWVPLLSAAPPADPVLTYALVLQPGRRSGRAIPTTS